MAVAVAACTLTECRSSPSAKPRSDVKNCTFGLSLAGLGLCGGITLPLLWCFFFFQLQRDGERQVGLVQALVVWLRKHVHVRTQRQCYRDSLKQRIWGDCPIHPAFCLHLMMVVDPWLLSMLCLVQENLALIWKGQHHRQEAGQCAACPSSMLTSPMWFFSLLLPEEMWDGVSGEQQQSHSCNESGPRAKFLFSDGC